MTQRADIPERRLWNAVLLFAAHDAKGVRGAKETYRQELSEWIHSQDFEWVCENAGQEPSSIRYSLLRLLSLKDDGERSRPSDDATEKAHSSSGGQLVMRQAKHSHKRSACRERNRKLAV